MEQLSGLAQVSQGTRRQCAQAASIICLMEVGCPPPQVSMEPKAAYFGRQEQGAGPEGRTPGFRQHLVRVCSPCPVTNDLQKKSGTFLQLSFQFQLPCPANPNPTYNPPPSIHTLVVNTVTSSSRVPSPPHHDSGHPCHLQTRWSRLVLYLQRRDLRLHGVLICLVG